MKRLMDNWREITFFVAVIGVVWQFQGVKADAGEAKEIMKQQADINAKLTTLITESSTKLAVYLELYGFDDEQAREWARMPRELPKDSLGEPVVWEPWLETSEDLKIGVRYVVDDSLRILIDTLWDFKAKEDK